MKRIILMGVPHHDNLGDIAIAYAEKEFIKDHFSNYELICFPEENLIENVKAECKNIKKEDLIFLHGGGNFGNQYINIEMERRYIIDNFQNNKIIMFPQTIYFTEDDIGNREMQISKNIYSKHKDLTIIAREQKSYEIIKKEFTKNKILFLPDIVMYLNKYEEKERDGLLVILRNDKEKSISDYETKKLLSNASQVYKKIEITDISYGSYLKEEELENRLFNMWEKYKQAELVITDRLHGMIFAAITKTPCIALGNYNHKVKSFYNTWFEKVETMQFIHNANEVKDAVENIRKCSKLIDLDRFKREFNKLVDIIKEN